VPLVPDSNTPNSLFFGHKKKDSLIKRESLKIIKWNNKLFAL